MKFLEEITRPADRWDLIAYRMYGDATRYAPIIDANRALFATAPLGRIPPVLEAGLKLRIPILDSPSPAAILPPWRTQ